MAASTDARLAHSTRVVASSTVASIGGHFGTHSKPAVGDRRKHHIRAKSRIYSRFGESAIGHWIGVIARRAKRQVRRAANVTLTTTTHQAARTSSSTGAAVHRIACKCYAQSAALRLSHRACGYTAAHFARIKTVAKVVARATVVSIGLKIHAHPIAKIQRGTRVDDRRWDVEGTRRDIHPDHISGWEKNIRWGWWVATAPNKER